MGSNLLGELVANNGTYFLSSGIFEQRNIDQIIVRGNGITGINIFTEDKEKGTYINVTNDYLSSQTLPDGLRITPKNSETFWAVEITSFDPTYPCGLEIVLA